MLCYWFRDFQKIKSPQNNNDNHYETVPKLGQDFFSHKLMLAYGKRMVRAKALELQEQFGECAIAEQSNGTVQTLRLTFAGHQEVKQYARR